MTELIDVLAETFVTRGWSIRDRHTLEAAGYSFDFIVENDTAVVFAVVLPANDITEAVADLTAEVASLTLRNVNSKSWEAYLLLAVTGVVRDQIEGLQDIQRDLNYCRKIVIDGDAILLASDPATEAADALTFLFPLEVLDAGLLPDIRALLLDRLKARSLPQELAQSLLDGFQDEHCHCRELVERTETKST